MDSANFLDLKNPLFRYTGQPPQPPPGSQAQSQSPTENFWGCLNQTSGGGNNSSVTSSTVSGAAQNQQQSLAMMVNGCNTNVNTSNIAMNNFVALQNATTGNAGAMNPNRIITTQGITSGVAGMNVNSSPRGFMSQPMQQIATTSSSVDMNFGNIEDYLRYQQQITQQPHAAQQLPQTSTLHNTSADRTLGILQNSH